MARERVGACLHIGLATVARVISFWNKNPGAKFDEPRETKRSGHSKYTSPELKGVIREFVIAENEATRPITAQPIASHVALLVTATKTMSTMTAMQVMRPIVAAATTMQMIKL
ncbi:hypothetical protein PC128_g5302 [Phytophthora cactorum]|nr:hypothetical protein PC120_g9415 [Phytophthora cactorum]KAG3199379.1 hypothetical protein PC128_g5302 [Phytophthora cactorum]KAG4061794.1 hypothetical protein PC123_g3353 [Phytophthora cactorum]